MSRSPERTTNADKTITILSVSPNQEDHTSLEQILNQFRWADFTWTLSTSSDVESATVALKKYDISIVMCESHLDTATWREVLSHVSVLNDPPLLIVTSRLADERLWAEALNVGAFDVIAKPFDTGEVIRTMTLAWHHWQERHGLHRRRTRQRKHDQGV